MSKWLPLILAAGFPSIFWGLYLIGGFQLIAGVAFTLLIALLGLMLGLVLMGDQEGGPRGA